jgi:hypothetical protein
MRNVKAELSITLNSTALTTILISPGLYMNLGLTGIIEAALELDINIGSSITLDSIALTTILISPVLHANSGVTVLINL